MANLNEAADFLRAGDYFVILSHMFPDGDTLGSSTALCMGLQQLGKHAMIRCSDGIGPKFQYLFEGVKKEEFTPRLVVSVDIADTTLFGEPLFSEYADCVDLCIDHHLSNSCFAKQCWIDPKSAATCEMIFHLLKQLGVGIDQPIAASVYTGITTDTGCFKYANVTPVTHRVGAELLETGINAADINRRMFDTKSRAHMEMERRIADTIEYYDHDRIAAIVITQQMIQETGATDDDIDGLSAIPRQIEGVLIGITVREKVNGDFKISLRAQRPVNASEICAQFGGGGHAGAAGCTFSTPLKEAKAQIIQAAEDYLKKLNQ